MTNLIRTGIALILLTLAACTKKDPAPGPEPFVNALSFLSGDKNLSNISPEATISLIANGQDFSNEPPCIDIKGTFENNNKLIAVESYTINTQEIQIDEPARSNTYHNFYCTGRPGYSDVLNFFGTDIDIRVKSSGFGSFSKKMYLPELIKLERSDNNKSNISRNKDLVIRWNADAQNKIPVGILIKYLPVPSVRENASLPGRYITIFRTTADSGEYIFKPEDLKDLPAGGYASIQIMRGNQDIVEVNDKEALITLLTSSITEELPIL